MPIYQVTYLSDGLKVKGYLGLPDGWSFPPQQIQEWIQQASGTSAFLPARFLARLDLAEEPTVQLQGLNPCQTEQSQNWPRTPEHDTSEGKVHETSEGRIHDTSEGEIFERLPGFIYCRGGIRKVGMVNSNWVAEFASYGYAVFAPSYRGNEGGSGRDEFGGADREDVHAAFRLMQQLPFIDPSRITVMGFSRGAVNATLTAVEVSGVHRLVLWGGVADLKATYQERVDLRRMLRRVVGGTPKKVPEEYQRRSPIALAEQIPCPVLVMHGTADVQVDISHGLAMHQRLSELGKEVTMHTFENEGHHLSAPEHQSAVRNMFAWVEPDKPAQPTK